MSVFTSDAGYSEFISDVSASERAEEVKQNGHLVAKQPRPPQSSTSDNEEEGGVKASLTFTGNP